jgi:hypothetical protein
MFEGGFFGFLGKYQVLLSVFNKNYPAFGYNCNTTARNMGMALMRCCAPAGMNFDTPNEVFLDNQSPDIVVFRYSMGDVVLSPGQSQKVTVLLKNENFNILDRNRNVLGGISVQADNLMFCHPDYLCVTAAGQVITQRAAAAPPPSTNMEKAPLLNT